MDKTKEMLKTMSLEIVELSGTSSGQKRKAEEMLWFSRSLSGIDAKFIRD